MRIGGWAEGRIGGWLALASALALSAYPPICLSAQTSDSLADRDTTPHAVLTLDTVIVRNSNIFDDEQAQYFGFMAKLTNSLHIRTRAAVIRRTLLIQAGDAYDSARVAESERAVRSLGVFRNVQVDTGRVGDRLALVVATADGWSTQPQANFSSVGGDQTWEVGIVEQNFLGFATTVAMLFRGTPDRRELELQYVSPKFLFRRAGLLAQYIDRSDGQRAVWRYGMPFYRTAARWALVTDGEVADGRVLVFRDDRLYASLWRRALRFGVTAGVALRATNRDYTRFWLGALWRREDIGLVAATLPRSVFGTVGMGVDVGHVRFLVARHLNSYARREDVNVSQSLRVGVWAAALGYPAARAGLAPDIRGQLSSVWRSGFATLRANGHGVYTDAGLDSGRARASVTVVDQRLPRQTWALFAEGGLAQRPREGTEFDLWLERSGPRFFRAHYFTGTRMWWVMLENRILVSEEFGGLVGVGLAPFVEWGGAWYADESPRLGGSAGLALRLGPTRAVGGDATEISVGVRFGPGIEGKWALTFRRGFEL